MAEAAEACNQALGKEVNRVFWASGY